MKEDKILTLCKDTESFSLEELKQRLEDNYNEAGGDIRDYTIILNSPTYTSTSHGGNYGNILAMIESKKYRVLREMHGDDE